MAGLDHLQKIVSVTPSDKMTSSSRAIKDSTRTRPSFEIAYDKLIVAVGAENNTFGTPGVYEHAHFLKEIVDARRIRAAVIDAFESACNPGQSETERKRLFQIIEDLVKWENSNNERVLEAARADLLGPDARRVGIARDAPVQLGLSVY